MIEFSLTNSWLVFHFQYTHHIKMSTLFNHPSWNYGTVVQIRINKADYDQLIIQKKHLKNSFIIKGALHGVSEKPDRSNECWTLDRSERFSMYRRLERGLPQ